MTNTNTHTPTINRAKLLEWNLRRPLLQRIHAEDLQERVSFASVRGNLVAFHATISAEVAATLNAARSLTDALMEL